MRKQIKGLMCTWHTRCDEESEEQVNVRLMQYYRSISSWGINKDLNHLSRDLDIQRKECEKRRSSASLVNCV
jgi:hypothetical protein